LVFILAGVVSHSLEINEDLAVPLGFHDDVAYLDDAEMGEGTVEIVDDGREIFVGFALGMLVVKASELGVIVDDAVGRGLSEASAFHVIRLHVGVEGVFGGNDVLLATRK
jgi:hypothetical protein